MSRKAYHPIFLTKRCSDLTDEQIQCCFDLYRKNYGVYDGKDGKHKRNQRVTFPLSGYESYRNNSNMFVSLCFNGTKLLGHAFFLKKKLTNGEICTWVTQLVVNSQYRMRGIGTRLLQSAWGFSNYFAWGLATANALTIKALESATWRTVDPNVICQNLDCITSLCEDIAFARGAELRVSDHCSQIDSKFFPIKEEHRYNPIYVERLGALPNGYEWLAFTFRSQDKMIDGKHFEELLNFSYSQLMDAYNRMEMNNQAWTHHTSSEIDFIESVCKVREGSHVLDLGCGQGRHSIELVKRGYNVRGVDVGGRLLDYACQNSKNELSEDQLTRICFNVRDCRKRPYHKLFDLVLCLYDVIGTYRQLKDNQDIIHTIADKLKLGGYAVVSVMNMELTRSIAKHRCRVADNPSQLLRLPASNIMQKTGDVFNPDYFLLDDENHLVYRKEQFDQDGLLSSEYVIADYRFTMQEIISEFESVGLKVEDARYVQAGHWDIPLSATDPKAKEILLVLKKAVKVER